MLREALRFIDAHADQEIGVPEIAEAAHTSVRALQRSFRHDLGTTPLRHLRGVRLSRAHDDLRDGHPGVTTVADVAMHWHFFHLGRFAAEYHDAFGELPSTTLAR